MTVMIGASATAPLPADAAPPADSSASERPPTFGPALSRARAEVAGQPSATGKKPAGTTADGPKDDDQPSQSNDETSVEAERPSVSMNDADKRTVEDTEPAAASAPAAAFADVPAAGDPAVFDHPTAKGEVGAGGPSTDPKVEGAAPPDTTDVMASDDNQGQLRGSLPGVAADGSTQTEAAASADRSALASPTTEHGDGTVGRGPHADARVPKQMPSETVSANDPVVADVETAVAEIETEQPASMLLGSETAGTEVELDGQAPLAGAHPLRAGGGRSTDDSADGGAADHMGDFAITRQRLDNDDSAGSVSADGPEMLDGQLRTPVSNTSTAGADATVVLASEARSGVNSNRPVPTAAPTPGPLDSAEGSLWEDVRLAFDRVRSSAEGQEVRIRLRPAELGELLVQIKTQGDHVAVRLTASSSAAQQTLIDDRLRLATELARAGFEEGSVDISQQENGTHGNRNPGSQDERGRGRTIATPHPGLGARQAIERRDPIRTESVFRPGRHAYSTISLTL